MGLLNANASAHAAPWGGGQGAVLAWSSQLVSRLVAKHERGLDAVAADPAFDLLRDDEQRRDQRDGAEQARQYRRSVISWGLSPTGLRRVGRLQKALSALAGFHGDAEHQLKNLSSDLGFSDPSHMSREVLRMTSFRPRQLAARAIGPAVVAVAAGNRVSEALHAFPGV